MSCISDCCHSWNPPLLPLLLPHWFILQLYFEKYSRQDLCFKNFTGDYTLCPTNVGFSLEETIHLLYNWLTLSMQRMRVIHFFPWNSFWNYDNVRSLIPLLNFILVHGGKQLCIKPKYKTTDYTLSKNGGYCWEYDNEVQILYHIITAV